MKTVLLAVMSLFLCLSSVNAETFLYPADDPIFSVSFPDEWIVETEEELLQAMPVDETIYIALWAMEDVDDIDLAMEALDEELGSIIENVEAKDPQEVMINEIPFIIIDGKATVEEEIPVEFSVVVFSTDGETFFVGLYFGSKEDVAKYRTELDEIIKSVSIP